MQVAAPENLSSSLPNGCFLIRCNKASAWYEEFRLRRSEDGVKGESVRKAFNRTRNWLQEPVYPREYDDKVWFIDETDGQDI